MYTVNPLERTIEDVRWLTIRDERRRIDKSGVEVMTHLARAAKQNAGTKQTRDVSLHLHCVLSILVLRQLCGRLASTMINLSYLTNCHSNLLMILHVHGLCIATYCTQHLLVGYFAVVRSLVLSSLLQHAGGDPGRQCLDFSQKPPQSTAVH